MEDGDAQEREALVEIAVWQDEAGRPLEVVIGGPELFLRLLTRKPTVQERRTYVAYLKDGYEKRVVAFTPTKKAKRQLNLSPCRSKTTSPARRLHRSPRHDSSNSFPRGTTSGSASPAWRAACSGSS